jgi:hypothetical protein
MQASREEEEEEVRLFSNVHSLGKKLVPTTAVNYDDPWPRSKKASSNTSLQLFTAIHSFISCMINVRKKKDEKTRGNTHTRKEGFVLILHRDQNCLREYVATRKKTKRMAGMTRDMNTVTVASMIFDSSTLSSTSIQPASTSEYKSVRSSSASLLSSKHNNPTQFYNKP